MGFAFWLRNPNSLNKQRLDLSFTQSATFSRSSTNPENITDKKRTNFSCRLYLDHPYCQLESLKRVFGKTKSPNYISSVNWSCLSIFSERHNYLIEETGCEGSTQILCNFTSHSNTYDDVTSPICFYLSVFSETVCHETFRFLPRCLKSSVS